MLSYATKNMMPLATENKNIGAYALIFANERLLQASSFLHYLYFFDLPSYSTYVLAGIPEIQYRTLNNSIGKVTEASVWVEMSFYWDQMNLNLVTG